jgi:hypothetical protein
MQKAQENSPMLFPNYLRLLQASLHLLTLQLTSLQEQPHSSSLQT